MILYLAGFVQKFRLEVSAKRLPEEGVLC
jgi:hypothetical protein